MTDASNRTFTIDGLPWPTTTGVGSKVAGRYLLIRELGRGGGGSVYEARDERLDEIVAVKLIPILGLQGLPRIRREVTALRRARLPGVVRLRDDGLERGDFFLVMDRIVGQPFPGAGSGPRRWEELRPVALRLLEILATVHYAGLVHLDLKPANVLVDAVGQPWVLDFGIARGTALGEQDPTGFQGTLAYAAPEQIHGLDPGVRADLYAVGVMLHEALAGQPRGGGQLADRFSAARRPPPPSLKVLAPDLPEHVHRLIDLLTREDPAERPADTLAAIRLLGEAPRAALDDLPLPTTRARSEEDLRPLFRGPDLFLHLREDAATELWRRTGGHPRALHAELRGWVSAGLAWREGALVVVGRGALDRLASGLRVAAEDVEDPPLSDDAAALLAWIRLAWPDATTPLLEGVLGWSPDRCAAAIHELRGLDLIWDLPEDRLGARPTLSCPEGLDRRATQRALAEALPPRTPARLRHQLEGDAPADALIAEIMALDAEAAERGLSSDGGALIEVGLSVARQEGDEDLELHMLERLTVAALQSEARGPIDRALYELGRAAVAHPEIEGLRLLLQAADAARAGEVNRARSRLEEIPPFQLEELEIWKAELSVESSRKEGCEAEERTLTVLAEGAQGGSVERRARYLSWLGRLRYHQGRFMEAAELHGSAASLRRTERGRVVSTLNGALALLEDARAEEALALAEGLQAWASERRQAILEAHATWLLRSAAYRTGRALVPSQALVAGASSLSEPLEGLFALREAAIAWRAGETVLALELAARAERRARAAEDKDLFVLARALGLACERWPDRRDLEATAQGAAHCKIARIAAQALALIYAREGRPEWRARVLELAATRREGQDHHRLDLLSWQEVLAICASLTPGENRPLAADVVERLAAASATP